mmetsp:Transcript_6116/g.8005  ORF Transcript_6116/g.8005 Transcript_6116/m.8005 type:complete len:468 (-) Transcript_6116:1088-2491(-)
MASVESETIEQARKRWQKVEKIVVESLEEAKEWISKTKEQTLIYGEISFDLVANTLQKTNQLGEKVRSNTFVDIGAGRGVALICAALLGDWERIVGIELVENRVESGKELIREVRQIFADEGDGKTVDRLDKITLLQGDAFNSENLKLYSNSGVVFVNSTAFNSSLMQALAQTMRNAVSEKTFSSENPPPFLVTTSRRIPSIIWHLKDISIQDCSWGNQTVLIHELNKQLAVEDFVSKHEQQLLGNQVPKELWSAVASCIVDEGFERAQGALQLMIGSEEEIQLHSLRKLEASKDVFLVDHAATFASRKDAFSAIEQVPGLKERVKSLIGISKDQAVNSENLVENMSEKLGSFALGAVLEGKVVEERYFYLPDEVGAAALVGNQTEKHNCLIVPIFYVVEKTAFSILFLLEDVEEGERLCAKAPDGEETASLWKSTASETANSGVVLNSEILDYAMQPALDDMLKKN